MLKEGNVPDAAGNDWEDEEDALSPLDRSGHHTPRHDTAHTSSSGGASDTAPVVDAPVNDSSSSSSGGGGGGGGGNVLRRIQSRRTGPHRLSTGMDDSGAGMLVIPRHSEDMDQC